jgi:hypothetical protein
MFSKKAPSAKAAESGAADPVVINGDLVLYKNTRLAGNVVVLGDVFGHDGKGFSLEISGDLTARNVGLKNLELSGNVRAISMEVRNLHANNVSLTRELMGDVVSVNNLTADEITVQKIDAKGDISADYLFSMKSIKAKDILVGSLSADTDVYARNIEAKDSINARDLYYYMICHARRELRYRHAYPVLKGSRLPFISAEEINIKSDIYNEKRE